MYFARSNYLELERLTYILSGVAEPSDVIRDKNVSPFNIGEKIYLNDFSFEECEEFLKKSGLQLSAEVKNRLFMWAGGNPRMTWDICSEIESSIDNGLPLDASHVDHIVSELYFRSFDRAPVDHIRSIVAGDRELRKAIRDLRAGKSAEIPDSTKSKLYLTGITGVQAVTHEMDELKIKNQIIDTSLTDAWLENVERQTRGLLQLARESYDSERWASAIEYLEEYSVQNEINSGSTDAYRLAGAYFRSRRYGKAIDWLRGYLASGQHLGDVEASVRFMLGRAYIVSGEYTLAVPELRRVVSLGNADLTPMASGLLASTLLQLDWEKYEGEATDLSVSALDAASGKSPSPNSDARAVCWSNLATIEEHKRNISEAIELLDCAASEGSVSFRAFLTLRLLQIVDDKERRTKLLDELAPSVTDLLSARLDQRLDNMLSQIVLPALAKLRTEGRRDDFIRLLEYLEKAGEVAGSERHKTYDSVYQIARTMSDKADEILYDIIREFGDTPTANTVVLDALRLLIVSTNDYSVVGAYLDRLEGSATDGELQPLDFLAVSYISMHALNSNDAALSIRLGNVARRLFRLQSKPVVQYAIVLNMEIRRCAFLGNTDGAVALARELLESLERNKSLISEELREPLERTARRHIRLAVSKVQAVNRYRAFGRNTEVTVKYPDGRVVTGRFKAVQRDLVLGNCELLSPELPS